MATLDWIFVGVLLVSLVLGAWRGLVFEVLSLLSWAAAYVLARWFAMDAAHYLPVSSSSETTQFVAGFVLVFVACLMLGGLLAVVVKKLVSAVGLSPIDRALGAMFGVVRGILLLLVATLLAGLTPVTTSSIWQQSTGVSIGVNVLKTVRPMLPAELEKFLPL